MPLPIANNKAIGDLAECAAAHMLDTAGLKLLAKNVRYAFGELDLVMQDGNTVVFAEVRYRRDSTFGDGLMSVTRNKRQRIARAAQAFLNENSGLLSFPCRFDVIAISGALERAKFDWQTAAFSMDDC